MQRTLGKVFHEGPGFARDGSQFDRLFRDGEAFSIGTLPVRVMHTPGHTPACVSHAVGGTDVFVGGTPFSPGARTSRRDFPGSGRYPDSA